MEKRLVSILMTVLLLCAMLFLGKESAEYVTGTKVKRNHAVKGYPGCRTWG
ncbi:MAG: hypothetical protein PHP50_12145 [Lachnospiraceae bacterium]|nr:hypothetical protein [Lachnospiraceae bacterium]